MNLNVFWMKKQEQERVGDGIKLDKKGEREMQKQTRRWRENG